MAKTLKGMFTVVAMVAVVIMSSILTSCNSTEEGLETWNQSRKYPTPSGDTLSVDLGLKHNWSSEDLSVLTDTITVSATATYGQKQETDSVKEFFRASLSEKYNEYFITSDKKEVKALSTSFEDHSRYNLSEEKSAVIALSDGNELYVDVDIVSSEYTVFNNTYKLPTLTCDSVKFVKAVNEAPAATRASSVSQTYVSEVMNTTFYVDVFTHEVNTKNPREFTKRMAISAVRKILSPNGIKTATYKDKKHEAISETQDRFSFTEVYEYLGGEVVESSKSFIGPRLFQNDTFADCETSDFSWNWKSSNGYTKGTNEKSVVTGVEGWSCWTVTDGSGAKVGNSYDVWNTKYHYTIPRATYKDEYIEVSWDYVRPEVTEAGTTVSDVTSDGDYKRATVTNKINTRYLGFSQPLSETLGLYKAEVKANGYEFVNKWWKVENGVYTAHADYVVKYSDGTKANPITYELNKPWSVVANPGWSSYEANANQSTSGLTNTKNGSKAASEAEWSYNVVTYHASNNAKLNASTQKNGLDITVIGSVVLTVDGHKCIFDDAPVNVSDAGANVTKTNSTETLDTYQYSDKLNVNFGGDKKAAIAYGTILVKKEVWNPDIDLHFKSMSVTNAPSEDNSTYVITLSVHFDEGTWLIVLDKNATSIGKFEEGSHKVFTSDTNALLNGGAYKKGVWNHTVASDEGDYMLWKASNGSAIRSLNYISATAMNWYTDGGKITVHNKDYSYQFKDNVLTIKKGNTILGTYKTAK